MVLDELGDGDVEGEVVRKSRSSCGSEAKEYRIRRCEKASTASLLESVTEVMAERKRGMAMSWCVFAAIRSAGCEAGVRCARCRAERARMPWSRKSCILARRGTWTCHTLAVVEVEMVCEVWLM